MTLRVRDLVLLAAGVPGVVALFLPIGESLPVVPVEYYWDNLQDLKHWPPRVLMEFWGVDWMVALPVPILLLQARRLVTKREIPRTVLLTILVITVLLQLGSVGFALRLVTEINWSSTRGWLDLGPEGLYVLVPMLVLSAGNAWLLHRNWWRRESLVSTTEMFMMGAYIVVQCFWLLGGLLVEPVLAPKLMLWTCFVYAVTIAIRLHGSRCMGGTRSAVSP